MESSTALLNPDFGRHPAPTRPLAGWCRFKPIATLFPDPFSDKEVQGKIPLQIPLWLRNKDTYPAGGTSLLIDPGCKQH